ncbi:MAG: hypothetical protein PHI06_03755 [Desulfobulbaceae bacterium]|nr:hypothetical protein [Desulfobulbaceae bacterium]
MLSLTSRITGGRFTGRQRVWRRRKIRAARQAILVTSLVLLETGYSRVSQAGLGEWKPVLADYSANLTLQSVYEQDDELSNRGGNDTSRAQTFRQTVTLNTVGYVYHPNLMLFRIQGSHGEDQSRTDENDTLTSRRGGFENYAVEAKILRAKPYTLDLSTLKESPFLVAPIASSGRTRNESLADFRYSTQVHKAGLKYNATTVKDEAGSPRESTNTIDDYDSNYSFSKPKLGALENFILFTSARYTDDLENSSVFEDGTVTQQGTMANTFSYSIFTFDTNLNSLTSDTESIPHPGTASSYASDNLGFSESVDIKLPWNFNSSIDYINNTADSANKWTQSDPSATPTETKMLSESGTTHETLHFLLNQRLYESLDTNFLMEQDSLTTSRNDRQQDSTSNFNLLTGTNEDNKYELESKYTKILPHDSLATGHILSSDVQRKHLGLNPLHLKFTSPENNPNAYPLADDVDLNVLTVDVLRTGTGECRSASNTPSKDDINNCWLRLGPSNYDIDPSRLTIRIYQLTDVAGLDYTSFPVDPNSGSRLFTFRVNSQKKALDFTSQINEFGLGLKLFQLISAKYQHSAQTQDGNTAGRQLEPEITTDLIGMEVSLADWTFNADREWQRAGFSNTITEVSLLYTKSRTLWERLKLTLTGAAEKGWASNDRNDGGAQEEDITGYSYSLTGDLPLPYVLANLRAEHSYDYFQGPPLTRYSITSYGSSEPTRRWGINESTVISNSISLLKPFRIPWINFAGSAFARYRWQTATTINNDGINDGGKDRTYFSYGLNTSRAWSLGATSINFNANYAITKDIYDENNGIGTTYGFETWQREDETNNTTVSLTIIRKLF